MSHCRHFTPENLITEPESGVLTDTRIYGRRAIKRALVTSTWSGVINDQDVPFDWIDSKPRFLVGSRVAGPPRRPQGRRGAV